MSGKETITSYLSLKKFISYGLILTDKSSGVGKLKVKGYSLIGYPRSPFGMHLHTAIRMFVCKYERVLSVNQYLHSCSTYGRKHNGLRYYSVIIYPFITGIYRPIGGHMCTWRRAVWGCSYRRRRTTVHPKLCMNQELGRV